MKSDAERRAEYERFKRIDDAFRVGDLAALRAAVEDPDSVPNGPMPLAIAPCLDFGLLSDPDGIDASVACEGIRLCRRIAATAPLAGHNAGEMRPGASIESDRDLLAFASEDMQTVYHPTSTCRMGSDAHAVVDPELRVRGVESLWVADASVMPSVPRGHPNAVVAMIAERAAQWVERAMLR